MRGRSTHGQNHRHGRPNQKRILEINLDHAVLGKLQGMFNDNKEDPKNVDFANPLHGQALLAEGSPLPDPVACGGQVADLMVQG